MQKHLEKKYSIYEDNVRLASARSVKASLPGISRSPSIKSIQNVIMKKSTPCRIQGAQGMKKEEERLIAKKSF